MPLTPLPRYPALLRGARFGPALAEGARCYVLCATDAAAATGGQYLHMRQEDGALEAIDSSAESRDEALAKALWELSERLVAEEGEASRQSH